VSTAEIAEPFTRLPAELENLLVCPRCKCRLEVHRTGCRCTHPGCGAKYPLRNRIPVLFDDSNSLFSTSGVLEDNDQPLATPPGALRRALAHWTPTLSQNTCGLSNYHAFARELLKLSAAPRVLVIGSRVLGIGMEVLSQYAAIQVIESDVEPGPRPAVLFDAHDIPFEDGSFDGVIAQAVLEHVADAARCVSELRRVLKPAGIVYAETPFMQQVHEGAHDFTRFTHLGQRRLFRDFEEIDSGIACGPGMALAWSWQYFLMSFARSRRTRTLAKAVARCTAFYLKYFDRHLADRAGAYDAASGFYFLGRSSNQRLSDRRLVELYRGAVR
jgi:SAM-dependent methyltransferase/uncharacterized protein YbaR (Trm112 family)